ncbi:MAG TPA: hypothetical protein VLF41_02355 [Candidatus Nanoarchaeia archaeon]|nr:hypothetical protein [Candidatus Nanoarchaeia archaeon]
MTVSLYEDIILITEDYLGPAAQRFIDRQITFHLDKKPEQINKADLPKLAEWVKVSLALLTEDRALVDGFSERINALTR